MQIQRLYIYIILLFVLNIVLSFRTVFLLMLCLLIINYLNDANAQKEKINTATIDVELKPSPNTVNVGDVLNLGIVLENHGTKTNVTSIELLYPDWDTSFNDKLPLNLGTNQSKFLSLTTKVPYDLSAGTYQLVVSIKATGSEYFGESSVDVRRFQAFDLSGELPVSIIGIVITGITAYFIQKEGAPGKWGLQILAEVSMKGEKLEKINVSEEQLSLLRQYVQLHNPNASYEEKEIKLH